MAGGERAPLNLHWFLPTAGDSREVAGFGPTASRREADLDYLTDVARTAERMGFDAVLTPTGTFCEDAWLTTAALISATERLRFLVAFRPGLISPTLAGPAGGDLPAAQRRAVAAQHRDRRQLRRAAPIR